MMPLIQDRSFLLGTKYSSFSLFRAHPKDELVEK